MIRERLTQIGGTRGKEALRAIAQRLDSALPARVREQLPLIWIQTEGGVWKVRGLHVEKAPEPSSPDAGAPPPERDGFWKGLPPGYKLPGEAAEGEGGVLTEAQMRELIVRLRTALTQLDDVKDFATVGAIDEELYQLWRELERKMQVHRQSEAKHQLKDMFKL